MAAPARLGIMGGTFDPIHIGHLACAEQVREAYGLDAVAFIPAGSPVFKRDRDVTPADDRLAMCRLATESNPAFDVSAMEIERGGDTYTVDTLRELRAHYPDNVELVFITGADAVAKIFRWHESEAVAGLARFVAVTRPGYTLDDEMRATFEKSPFTVDFLEVTGLSVSSSDLRRRVSRGQINQIPHYVECARLHMRAWPVPKGALNGGEGKRRRFRRGARRGVLQRT